MCKFKKGDIVVYFRGEEYIRHLEKNSIHRITLISKNHINDIHGDFIYLCNKNRNSIKDSYGPFYSSRFITLKEYRNLKLKKIIDV